MANVTTVPVGEEGTLEFRLFFEKDGQRISPWHDIPLVADEQNVFNMVVEIPKGTNAKMELAPGEKLNPIKQDVKNGKLRFVADVNGAKGYPWNYGAFPQTWEDPTYTHPETNAKGDKDPLDVVDISSVVGKRGEIRKVKVLGTLALIDEGETDWKILAIDINDPDAANFNDVDDFEKLRPGYLKSIHDWFRDYKVPDGKPPNVFAFNGEAKNKSYALTVIEENHHFWKKRQATNPAT